MHQQPAGAKDSHLLSELICCWVNDEIKWNKIIFPIAASKGAEGNQRGKHSSGESGDIAAVFSSTREILCQKRCLRQAGGSALRFGGFTLLKTTLPFSGESWRSWRFIINCVLLYPFYLHSFYHTDHQEKEKPEKNGAKNGKYRLLIL